MTKPIPLLKSCAAAAALCGLALTACTGSDAQAFDELTRELFVSEMYANTLNMHYTIADPYSYGIGGYRAVLPTYSAEGNEQARAETRVLTERLDAIDPARLSMENAYTYELLEKALDNSLTLSECGYFAEPLSPASGAQTQLPILLAEYAFRSERDVEDYLSLLEQTDAYLASLLVYEQEKAAAGLSQSNDSLHSVMEQCDTVVTVEELDAGTHFLQETFTERLDELVRDGEITEDAVDTYTAENNRLLRTVVQPAYETLADGLFVLEGSAGISGHPYGLASVPGGRDYYEALLIHETGSYRSVDEIRELLEIQLEAESDAVHGLLADTPSLAARIAAGSHTELPLTSADEMLDDLQTRMADDFPALTGGSSAVVKPVSESLQPYTAPAYYLTAPLDDTSYNVIYINGQDTIDSLELYTTLAHEGYPGHLYQTVYANRRALETDENIVRQLLWYGGYLEGWAVYVEFIGYDYAAQMLKEVGRAEDALCVELERHERSALLCLYSLLDIMIHAENADRTEVSELLSRFGIGNPSAADAVYDYIAENPCNYLKYYLGYLEILDLKEQARQFLGSAYTDRTFHTFLLNAGASDFDSLQERLITYAASIE